jgi:hypothetical protein
MHTGRKTLISALVLVAALAGLASAKSYYLIEGGGGILLANSSEAYFFLRTVQRGYRVAYLAYPWAILKQYLRAVPEPDDERYSLLVVRVTPSAIERYALPAPENQPGAEPSLYSPVNGTIYANCQGVLCKWTGIRFEQATAEEHQRFDGISRLAPDINMDLGEWYKRGVGATTTPYQFSARVGGTLALSMKSSGLDQYGCGSVSIDLLRDGQTSDRIWYLDDHPRNVSKSQYRLAFQR